MFNGIRSARCFISLLHAVLIFSAPISVSSDEPVHRSIALLLDLSYSMELRETPGVSRIQMLKSGLRELLDYQYEDTEWALAAFSDLDTIAVYHSFTSESRDLLPIIGRLRTGRLSPVGAAVAAALEYLNRNASGDEKAIVMVILFINEEKPLPREKDDTTGSFSLRNIFKAPYVFVFLVLFFVRIARLMPVPFLPLFVQETRGTIRGVAAITGIISAARGVAAALGGISITRLADRHDKTRMIALLCAVAAVLAFPMFFTDGLWSFTGLFVISTFFLSGVEPILQSLMSVHTSPKHRGIIFGIQNMVGSLGWFCAPLIGSAVSIHLSIEHNFLIHALMIAGISLALWIIYYRRRSVRSTV